MNVYLKHTDRLVCNKIISTIYLSFGILISLKHTKRSVSKKQLNNNRKK